MSVAEIDSEAKLNVVETDPQAGPWTHCVLILEQPPLTGNAPPPQWRVSVTLTLAEPLGGETIQADLPTVVIGPLIHKRQIVAVAKYPGLVSKWSFYFKSDAGRATARVWLHPGKTPMTECGIFVVKYALQ